MSGDTISHHAPLWVWHGEGPASWHFITIDGDAAMQLAALEAMQRLETGMRRGFGSVKVSAQIGDSEWTTSVFPHKSSQGWLLPVKAAIRKAEGIVEGDEVNVRLQVL
tara:strand:- start:443 stop:766 length:324 start_codon:yes stop_codon:yes gene_type:complete